MMLQALREEVYKCNMLLPENDLVKMTSGNVSGRDPQTNLVVIKPSGVAYEKLSPENMVIVDLDGNVVEGDLTPSIDTETHLVVYRARPDVFGMVHTHSTYATSFAVLGQPIPPVTTTCGLIGGGVPLGRFACFGGETIGHEVVNVIGDSYAVIMQSHGVFTIGHSASHATRVAVEVEEMAKIAHLAMLRGKPIILTPEQIREVSSGYVNDYGQKK
nr:L-ribulose-5-phosphate 4-epimerase [Ornatilinea apprima]